MKNYKIFGQHALTPPAINSEFLSTFRKPNPVLLRFRLGSMQHRHSKHYQIVIDGEVYLYVRSQIGSGCDRYVLDWVE